MVSVAQIGSGSTLLPVVHRRRWEIAANRKVIRCDAYYVER
jgi:hypothetical protein